MRLALLLIIASASMGFMDPLHADAVTVEDRFDAPFRLELGGLSEYEGVVRDAWGDEWFDTSANSLIEAWVVRTELDYQAIASYHPDEDRCTISVNEDVTAPLMDEVLIHEVGHCLGLEHTNGGVMTPVTTNGQAVRGIDRAALSLYR